LRHWRATILQPDETKEFVMKKILILVGLATIMSAGVANAATQSCAELEKKIEAEMKSAKWTEADKLTAEATFKKGKEACSAKKEADAHKEFEAIQKMMPKT
jgi:Ni/Co efflux regulator RcnB